MGPKDKKDSTETNGNVYSAGKGREKTRRSSNPSNASFGALTQEDVDASISAARQMSRIFGFMQTCHAEISDIDKVHGLNMSQQEHIRGLERTLDEVILRKEHEMVRLQEENYEHRANAGRVEREREELERGQATLDDRHRAMEAEMQRQKDKEINELKQQFLEKSKAKVKQKREEFERKTQSLEIDKNGLEDTIKILEKKNIEAKERSDQQKENFELDKRSSQSHIKRLESELRQMNAFSMVSPQAPEF